MINMFRFFKTSVSASESEKKTLAAIYHTTTMTSDFLALNQLIMVMQSLIKKEDSTNA